MEHIIQEEKVNINRDAIEALLKMGRGDMRRVLNVLQSAAVAYPQEITFESLFLVTGNPVPKHIDAVFQSLLNDSFNDARKTLHDMCTLKGYALPDVLTLLNERVLDTQLPRRMKAHLLAKLADLEAAARQPRRRSSSCRRSWGLSWRLGRSRRPRPEFPLLYSRRRRAGGVDSSIRPAATACGDFCSSAPVFLLASELTSIHRKKKVTARALWLPFIFIARLGASRALHCVASSDPFIGQDIVYRQANSCAELGVLSAITQRLGLSLACEWPAVASGRAHDNEDPRPRRAAAGRRGNAPGTAQPLDDEQQVRPHPECWLVLD